MRLFEIENNIFYHVTNSNNLSSIMKNGLLPQSGDRSQKLNDFGIFLFRNLDDVETGMEWWLGDEYEEDDELILLKVTLPKNIKYEDGEFEVIVKQPIPPSSIEISDELKL